MLAGGAAVGSALGLATAVRGGFEVRATFHLLATLFFAMSGDPDLAANEAFWPIFVAMLPILTTSVLLARLGWQLIRYGGRFVQPTADEARKRDPREPVLFLRSFRDDDVRLNPWSVWDIFAFDDTRLSIEESLLFFQWLGPFICIGRPGERLPTLGASRLYVENERWQSVVADLIERARAIVFLARTYTPGIHWEIAETVRRKAPQTIVFVLPAPLNARRATYGGFRESIQRYFPRPLPDDPGEGRFLSFGDDWQPRFFPSPVELINAIAGHAVRPIVSRYHDVRLYVATFIVAIVSGLAVYAVSLRLNAGVTTILK